MVFPGFSHGKTRLRKAVVEDRAERSPRSSLRTSQSSAEAARHAFPQSSAAAEVETVEVPFGAGFLLILMGFLHG